MGEKILGLDVGMASCGFALIDIDEEKIICRGAHCFEKAETPKGESLAAPRRDARSARRRLRRKAQRIRHIKGLFRELGLKSYKESELPKHSPWELRVKALTTALTEEELTRALLHIAKRRGFKSSKKVREGEEDKKSDEGKLLAGARSLREEFLSKGYRTIGEFLAKQPKQRNDDGSYARTVYRSLHEEEVETIIKCQQDLGVTFATDELRDRFNAICFYQRPLRSTEPMVGYCTLEPKEKRAPKFAFTSELYLLLQKINNLKAISDSGEELVPSEGDIEAITQWAFTKRKVTYKQLRKKELFGVPDEYSFNLVEYARSVQDTQKGKKPKDPETETFFECKGFHEVRVAVEKIDKLYWKGIASNVDGILDKIIWILTVEQDYREKEKRLKELGMPDVVADALGFLGFSKHINLSIKAMESLIPFLRKGMRYDQALQKAGYPDDPYRKSKGLQKLPPIKEDDRTRNPVVDRAVAKTRKVINAVIREHGLPDKIHIEVARDMGKSFDDRRKIERRQKDNLKYKKDLEKHFIELFDRPSTGREFARFRMWKEQKHRCPYSLKEIPPSGVIDEREFEVDHILPFSRSFDDSLNNRVLCYTFENQQKGNRTPYEVYGGTDRWEQILLNAEYLPYHKRRKLLIKNASKEIEKDWKSRHLNDSRYVARYLYNYIRSNLALGDASRRHVFTRTGRLTDYLRWNWGLARKDRLKDDRHHAMDALIVACATSSIEQEITRAAQRRELKTGEDDRLPLPWESFRLDAERAIDTVFVSRQVNRKVTGPAHKATIKSKRVRSSGEQIVTQRVRLKNLTSGMIDSILDGKAGERNHHIASIVRERFEAFGGKADKAFAEPLYLTSKDGRQGPEIKAVTIKTDDKSGLILGDEQAKRKAMANNGDMVRVDVFRREGKNYLVPVYVANFAAANLPNLAIVGGKTEDDWLEMTGEFQFCFSLYPNDYVKTVDARGRVREGYYRGTDRSTGAIHLLKHEGGGEALQRSIGVQNLKEFKKFTVSYFGDLYEVKKEKRVDVAKRIHRK